MRRICRRLADQATWHSFRSTDRCHVRPDHRAGEIERNLLKIQGKRMDVLGLKRFGLFWSCFFLPPRIFLIVGDRQFQRVSGLSYCRRSYGTVGVKTNEREKKSPLTSLLGLGASRPG